MDEDILKRVQSIEFSSSKIVDYLSTNSNCKKTDYLLENYLINNKRRYLIELNEALDSGM